MSSDLVAPDTTLPFAEKRWNFRWYWIVIFVLIGFVLAYGLTVFITSFTSKDKAFDLPSLGVAPGKWYLVFQYGDFISQTSCEFSSLAIPSDDKDPMTLTCYESGNFAVPKDSEGWLFVAHAGVPGGEGKSFGISRLSWTVFPLLYENMTVVYRINTIPGRPDLIVVTGFRNLKKYIAVLSSSYNITNDAATVSAYLDVNTFLVTARLPALFPGNGLGDGWVASSAAEPLLQLRSMA